MEPLDPRMEGLLGGAGPGGPDELREIVARAGRRRGRLAAAAAALALAAGGGVGYGVASATSGGGSGGQIVATAPVSGSSGASIANGAAPAVGGTGVAVGAPKFQNLFTRQVGAIDIRGFLVSLPNPMPYQGAYSCGVGSPSFQAEVSTPHMVGTVGGSEGVPIGAITFTQPSVIGDLEGDPTVVVIAHTASDVARVKMAFTGGSTDQMAPVQGWSALAASGGQPKSVAVWGTMTAFDHAGKLLETVSVPTPMPVPGVGYAGSPPSGSAGTGSAGAPAPGSLGTGTTGSGTVHAAGGAVTSPPATDSPTSPPAQGNAAYPCRVPPGPASPPSCTPPSTVKGANYACASTGGVQVCTVAPPANEAGSSGVSCTSRPLLPTTSGTTVAPNSRSGG